MSALVAERLIPDGLAERIRDRDPGAEAELIRLYASGLRILFDAQGVSPATARDLFQDTFWAVILRLRRTDEAPPDDVAGFVRRVALDLAAAERRRATRRRRFVVEGIDLDRAFEAAEDPVQTLAAEQVCETVRTAVDSLRNPRDREVIRAHYLRGEDKANVCQRIGTTPAHFDVVVHRARRRLRALLVQLVGTDRL